MKIKLKKWHKQVFAVFLSLMAPFATWRASDWYFRSLNQLTEELHWSAGAAFTAAMISLGVTAVFAIVAFCYYLDGE